MDVDLVRYCPLPHIRMAYNDSSWYPQIRYYVNLSLPVNTFIKYDTIHIWIPYRCIQQMANSFVLLCTIPSWQPALVQLFCLNMNKFGYHYPSELNEQRKSEPNPQIAHDKEHRRINGLACRALHSLYQLYRRNGRHYHYKGARKVKVWKGKFAITSVWFVQNSSEK